MGSICTDGDDGVTDSIEGEDDALLAMLKFSINPPSIL